MLEAVRAGDEAVYYGRWSFYEEAVMKDAAQESGGLSANALKLLAVAAMAIDHAAWLFIPSATPEGLFLHIIGRLTMPIMCFCIAEGYYHTSSVRRYALRLLVFALISYLPFVFYKTGRFPAAESIFQFNVIYTLLLGLAALSAWDSIPIWPLRAACVALCCILSLSGDWGAYGVCVVLAFGIPRGSRAAPLLQRLGPVRLFAGAVVGLVLWNALSYLPYLFLPTGESVHGSPSCWDIAYNLALPLAQLLAIPLFLCYSGQRGGRWGKWSFYLFYPLHLVLLRLAAVFFS